MELKEIKEELSLPSNIKNEDVKTYLIHEKIASKLKVSENIKSSLFSNIFLKLKTLLCQDYNEVYTLILEKTKTENELNSLLSSLNKKIEKNYNIDQLRKIAINSLNADSNFYISLGNTDTSISFINATLDNKSLVFDWDYNRKEITDKSKIAEFKSIILKYKEDLFEYTSKQVNTDKTKLRNLVIKGKMKNSLQGEIDSLKISIYPELSENEKELNKSYFNLKSEVISFLENNINTANEIK